MLNRHLSKYPLMLIALMVFLFAASGQAFGAATITVVPVDGPNEGFNDPTPVAPVGGNPGTTRGQQRLIAFQFAADLWGATLDSNVQIFVTAAFNPLGANVLGSAGTTFVFSDFGSNFPFPGPLFSNTWHHSALSDKRAGAELNPGFADINAQFSSDFNFYLGLDNNHGPLNDLVVVVLHELGHGLGFSAFANGNTGANFAGRTDVYSQQPDWEAVVRYDECRTPGVRHQLQPSRMGWCQRVGRRAQRAQFRQPQCACKFARRHCRR
jgi:hypothetical protein